VYGITVEFVTTVNHEQSTVAQALSCPEIPNASDLAAIPFRLDFLDLAVDLMVGPTNFALLMRVFIMNMKLKSFALAVSAVLGSAGFASAQQWAPSSPSPYQLSAAPAMYSQASPSDESCVAGCTNKGGGHAGSCGDGCSECRDPRGLWGGVEFVFLFPKGRELPALVTTSTPNTPAFQAGVLGLPTTQVLFGNDRIGDQLHAAARITVGKWLDDEESVGVGVRYFGTEGDRTSFSLDSTENPIIARPFYNSDPLVDAQDSLRIAYPGRFTGNVGVTTSSDLYSFDVLGRVNLDYGSNYRLDVIGGYQNTRLDDGLTIGSFTTDVGGINNPLGTTIAIVDGFDARDIFNGGSLGLWYEHYRGPWVVAAMAKFGLGQMSETVRISGSNTVNTGGGPVTTPGGLLAQPTNIGTYHRKETAFVPEFALNLNRRLTDHLDVTVGYSIIYFSSVVLAGDQIDTVVNGTQILGGPLLGPADPSFQGFNDSDYFVHGLSLGLNFHF